MVEVSLMLPRSAFTPREVARAGDVWRAFQEVAVLGSIERGWPPERYRNEGCSFIVRDMSVVHHREAIYGENIRGRTWISRVRREMFFQRECRLNGIASATQQWVHVSSELVPSRGPKSLVEAFPIEEHEASIEI